MVKYEVSIFIYEGIILNMKHRVIVLQKIVNYVIYNHSTYMLLFI